MSQTLTQEQALSVLIQGARVAQSKGAFTLEDAKVVAEAIAVFTPPQTDAEAPVAEAVAEESGN